MKHREAENFLKRLKYFPWLESGGAHFEEQVEGVMGLLERQRRVLGVVARSMDGWGEVDLHERAFEVAVTRDPSYESGDKEPTDDDYAQALLEAVLEQGEG